MGLSAKDVCARLGMSKQNFYQSGVSNKIARTYPFGNHFPLYDEHDVKQWELAIKRRRGLIALGRLQSKARLVDAIKLDEELDLPCPNCSGYAVADKGDTAEDYLRMVEAGTFPERWWCEQCGVSPAPPAPASRPKRTKTAKKIKQR